MIVTMFIIVLALLGFAYHTLIIGEALALWFTITHLGILLWIKNHPLQTALYVLGYFLAGAVWSVIKWWFRETDKVRKVREDFKHNKYTETWEEFIRHRKSDPSSHREDFILWVSFWPLNMLWTLLDDPIRRACRRIVAELQGVYQRITDHVWRKP